ncbi:DUF4838 domain-containing protein [Paenibacillus eucommiae]|uniref:SLH domain-containing protein n=1 Tax=Paenibacillus eucommiae TaxID=1355755 RepID=A0ABS4ILV7_9BACL|nr:DUF4838 domain-containing protein [Paenibacillus eucommiae]MBP1988542.1 hypothetical protein [Paenibacillus eucommiae]
MKQGFKRVLSLVMSLCIVITAVLPFSSTVLGSGPELEKSDLAGHWAKPVMSKWIYQGLIQGYGNNEFRPEQLATRAEFVMWMDQIFQFAQHSPGQSFVDVRADAWYSDAVSNLYQAGIIEGVGGGRFEPEAQISREDAAVIAVRAFKIALSNQGKAEAVGLTDYNLISSYALEAVSALYAGGYVQGRGNQQFAPKGKITRAEIVQLIDNLMGTLINEPGTFSSNAAKNMLVNTDGVKLQDVVISGNLFVTQGVGEGNLILDGVTVKGSTYVMGGGKDSIKLRNSKLQGPLIINKWNSQIRVAVSGATEIPQTIMLSGGILEEEELASGSSGFNEVDVNMTDNSEGQDVTLSGVFEQVRNHTKGAKFKLGKNTVVRIMNFDAPATVSDEGAIELANLNVSGVILSKWPVKAKFGDRVSATIASQLVTEDNRSTSSTTPPGDSGNVVYTPAPTLTPTSTSTPTVTPTNTPVPTTRPGEGEEALQIVNNGNPAATVVISIEADNQTRDAALKLIQYVKKSTGVELPLVVDVTYADNVIAENGSVQIQFANEPDTVPVKEDFTVQPIADGVKASIARPSSVVWDAANLTAILAVPAVEPATIQQSVSYAIRYRQGAAMHSHNVIIAADAQAPLNLNGSFEIGYAGVGETAPWMYWSAAMKRSNEQVRSGSFSLKATGSAQGWLVQEIAMTQYGQHDLSAYLYFPQGMQTNGSARLFINLLGTDDAVLGTPVSGSVLSSDSNGSWVKLNLSTDIPAAIDGRPVRKIRIGVDLNGFAAQEAVYIDDVQLIKVNPGYDYAGKGEVADQNNGEGHDQAKTQIYVGKEGLTVQEQAELLDGMDNDGFVIQQVGGGITIAGPTSWGTEFGVNEFLERYVGVRWLMPGDDWEDVPVHTSLAIPANDQVRQEPAFFSRAFENLGNWAHEAWKRNNRMHGEVQFAHNFFNLFPPKIYKDTHPQFYPQGADLELDHGWQPCFTAEGIVEEAIQNINAYFEANPDEKSYSIGINDTTNFCEANPSHPNYPNKLNSIGMVDMSNIFFTWVNEVAEGVFAEHPDKLLGTYAYYNVYDPPSGIQIDPRVVVYITDERLSWVDPDLRNAGHSLTEAWEHTGATIAFYEYLYGSPYLMPRTYFHVMADNYRYAAESGAAAYYSELYPNFGEGPKPWLSAKLQWNPFQDEDALLDEWYERAVGSAAKSDLRAYYQIWQEFWEEDVLASSWYTTWRYSLPRANFMPLYVPTYLKDVSAADITESRRLLESVVDKAGTPKQRKRAEDLLQLFSFYEASYLSYPKYNEEVTAPGNVAEAMTLLDNYVQRLELMEERFRIFDQIAANVALEIAVAPINWNVMSNDELWLMARWIAAHPGDAVQARVDDLAMSSSSLRIREFMNNVLSASYGTGVRNPGFEDGMNGWFDWPDTRAELTDEAHSGTKALKVSTSSREQTVFIEAGKTYEISFYGKRTGTELNLVGINYWDVPGIGLKGDRVAVDSDAYKKYVIRFTAPAQFSHATIVVYKDVGTGSVFVDDFTLREWSADEAVLSAVTAENGMIHAKLSHEPAVIPTVADFTVKPLVNGVAAQEVHPNAVTWDAATQTATLTVPAVAVATVQQSIVYGVSYNNGTSMDSSNVVVAADAQAPLNFNPSFEIGYAGREDAVPWMYWNATIMRSNEQAKSGNSSTKAVGTVEGWLVQEMAMTQHGQHELSAYVYFPQGVQTNGAAQLFINLMDADGNVLDTPKSGTAIYTDSNGSWVRLSLNTDIPAAINRTPVNKVRIGVSLSGFAGQEVVYIDDAQLIKVSEAGEASLSEVTAENGVIYAKLSHAPMAIPTAADFKVQPFVNGAAAQEVHPNAVNWDATTKTATLTVPAVAAATVQQSVVYGVSYNNGASMDSSNVVVAADAQAPLNLNPSFEIGFAGREDAVPWMYWNATILRSNEQARSGNSSLKAVGTVQGWLVQEMPMTQHGQHELSAYVYFPQEVQTNGAAQLFINLMDAEGNVLDTPKSGFATSVDSGGSWFKLILNTHIPANINGTPVSKIRIGMDLSGFTGQEVVYMDDAQIIRVD